MQNKKGQALVEFVLVLPILIMLIFAVIDFGRIFVIQNQLETSLGLINQMNRETIDFDSVYNEVNKNSNHLIDVFLTYDNDGYLVIQLERTIELITPGLNLILSNPYTVSVQRVIKYG